LPRLKKGIGVILHPSGRVPGCAFGPYDGDPLNVLLICVNRNNLPAPVMPHGACVVADAAAAAGHRTRLLDLMFQR